MFENLVSSYYAEEELDNAFLNKIGECFHRAKAFMTYEEKQILQDTHSFHDWYLIEYRVYCEKNVKKCKLVLSRGPMVYQLFLSEIISFSTCGELVSDNANYPQSWQNSSIAQVLTLWLDYQNCFGFCLLLDNERYINIQARNFCIQK